MNVKYHSIPLCIILSILTFGIYGIYWFIVLTNEANSLAPKNATASGGLAFVLTIITFGIYNIYWNYKMGCKVDEMNETPGGNTGLIYLLIGLVGFNIINCCLIQDTLNRFANA